MSAIVFFTWKQPSDTIVNSANEFLDPENVYLDTKIIIPSYIEPVIMVAAGLHKAAILKTKYGQL